MRAVITALCVAIPAVAHADAASDCSLVIAEMRRLTSAVRTLSAMTTAGLETALEVGNTTRSQAVQDGVKRVHAAMKAEAAEIPTMNREAYAALDRLCADP